MSNDYKNVFFSLENSHFRGDVMAVYKFLNGDYLLTKKHFIGRTLKKMHAQTMNLDERWFNLKLRVFFFFF